MVTIGKKYGRLANRLWIFSYFAANAIEHNYELIYRNFDEYIKYFEATSKNNFHGYPIKARLSKNLVVDHILYYLSVVWVNIVAKFKPRAQKYEVMRIKDRGEGFDLNHPEFVKKAKNSHIIIKQGGYWYKDNSNLEKHAHLIRKFFEPKSTHKRNVNKLVNKSLKKGNCLVGVHLRKTDFMRHLNGKYYYDDTVYRSKILELNELLKKEGKNPVFILCSDEKISEENFSDLNFVVGKNHLIEDLYTFSKCHYIIGPPSTYTSWASFYGQVPAKFLVDDAPISSLNDFKIVKNISQMYGYLQNN